MRMCSTLIDLEFGQQLAAEAILWNHPLNGVHNEALRMVLTNLGDRTISLAAFPAGIAHEIFVSLFFAGQTNLFGINNDNKIPSVPKWCKNGLVLPAQDISDLNS